MGFPFCSSRAAFSNFPQLFLPCANQGLGHIPKPNTSRFRVSSERTSQPLSPSPPPPLPSRGAEARFRGPGFPGMPQFLIATLRFLAPGRCIAHPMGTACVRRSGTWVPLLVEEARTECLEYRDFPVSRLGHQARMWLEVWQDKHVEGKACSPEPGCDTRDTNRGRADNLSCSDVSLEKPSRLSPPVFALRPRDPAPLCTALSSNAFVPFRRSPPLLLRYPRDDR